MLLKASFLLIIQLFCGGFSFLVAFHIIKDMVFFIFCFVCFCQSKMKGMPTGQEKGEYDGEKSLLDTKRNLKPFQMGQHGGRRD